jgi:hypothetical protein
MREIFTLIGRITMEGAQFAEKQISTLEKAANKIVNPLNIMGKNMERAGKNLTLMTAPIAAAVAGMSALAIKTGEYSEHINNLAKKTGLSTDSLQEMQHVATQAGIDFDTFVGSITQLTRQLPNLQKGMGPAHDALKRMGLNAFDASGKIKDMNTLFPEIINKLQGVGNATERVALAQQIFGKGAGELAPILGMTSRAFADQREEAHKLGLVMSGEALDAADTFGDNVDKAKEQLFALGRGLASAVIPIFTDVFMPIINEKVIPALQAMTEKIQGAAKWFNSLNPAIKDAIVYFGGFVVLLGPLLLGVGKALTMFKTMITTFKLLSAVFLTNPLGLIITSIGLLITAGILLYKNWDFVKDKLLFAWDSVVYGVEQAVSYMKQLFYGFLLAWLNDIDTVAKYIPGLNTAIADTRVKLLQMIKTEQESRFTRKELRQETEAAAKAAKKMSDATVTLTTHTNAANNAVTNLADVQHELSQAFKDSDAQNEKTNAEAMKKRIEANTARVNLEDQWQEKLQSVSMSESDKLEFEYRDAIQTAKQKGVDTTDIESYYAIKRIELAKKEAADRKKIQKEAFDMGVGFVNQTFDLFSKNTQNKMALIDNETAKQKEAILASTMGEQEKQAAIANLETAAEVRKKKLTQDQAKRDKAQAIFSAIISTAEAVIKAWTLGPVLGPIMSGVAAAIGAAQIALIAAQPIPEMAAGALVNPSPSGIHAIVGEGKQSELIMPMETGLQSLIDGVSAAVLPATSASAATGSGTGRGLAGRSGDTYEFHMHAGTFITDDAGLKNLERTLYKFRIADAQRKGNA